MSQPTTSASFPNNSGISQTHHHAAADFSGPKMPLASASNSFFGGKVGHESNMLSFGAVNDETFRAEYTQNLVSSFDALTRSPSVPLVDGPFNEWNSVYSSSPRPRHIFDSVLTALSQETEVDYEAKPKKFRIRGRKFLSHIVAEFQIHIMQMPDDDTKFPLCYVVEFQRRSGDSMVFQSFLLSVVSKLRKMELIEFSAIGNDQSALESSPPKANNPTSPTTTTTTTTAPPSATPPKKRRNRRRRSSRGSNSNTENARRSLDRDEQEAREMPKRSLSPLSDSDRSKLEQIPAGSLSFDHDSDFIEALLEHIHAGHHAHKRSAAALLASESAHDDVVQHLWHAWQHYHDELDDGQQQQQQQDGRQDGRVVLKKLVAVIYECLDVQVVRALAVTLCNCLKNCEEALIAARSEEEIFEKLRSSFRRWSRGMDTTIGDKTVCVIPSRQTAIALQSCIDIIRGRQRRG